MYKYVLAPNDVDNCRIFLGQRQKPWGTSATIFLYALGKQAISGFFFFFSYLILNVNSTPCLPIAAPPMGQIWCIK